MIEDSKMSTRIDRDWLSAGVRHEPLYVMIGDEDNQRAEPVEGLIARVDVQTGQLIEVLVE